MLDKVIHLAADDTFDGHRDPPERFDPKRDPVATLLFGEPANRAADPGVNA